MGASASPKPALVSDGAGQAVSTLTGFDPARVWPSPRLVPVTGKAARRWIADNHRHLPRLQGALFAVGVANYDQLVGVGTAGNPPRVWQGTGRFVITRVAVVPDLPPITDRFGEKHAFPACTMIYRALCRAGRALGYREAWTYTLPHESGQSLRAAGFIDMGLTDGGEHDRPSRARAPAVNAEPKRRWMRRLAPPPMEDRERETVLLPFAARGSGGQGTGAAVGGEREKATGTHNWGLSK